MKQIGFEREYFLVDRNGAVELHPAKYGFPTDEFGVLVEARGQPSDSIDQAITSLLVVEAQLKRKAEKEN